MGIGSSNLGGMMSAMGQMTPSSTATPNTNAQPAPQPIGGKGGMQGSPAVQPKNQPAPQPIGGKGDLGTLKNALQPRQLSPAEQAFQNAHPGYANTTYAPGYQQSWLDNFNAQQAQPQNQLGGGLLFPPGGQTPPPGMSIDEFVKSPYMGNMTMDFRQPVEFEGKQYDPRTVESYQNYVNQSSQPPLQNTGQQITDPATGRNFTIGGPLTRDIDTGLAYKRAMEAFNQSNQQNQQPGGQAPASQGPAETNADAQTQIEAMLRARQQQTPQQRNPYVDQNYFQGRMQQQMMSPYQQPFMQRMPMMGGYGMPPMMGGYGMPPMMGGYGMPPMMGGFGGYGMPQPMGGKGFNPMMFRGF